MSTYRCIIRFIAVLTSFKLVVCSAAQCPVLTFNSYYECADFPTPYDVADRTSVVFYARGTSWVGIALTSSVGDSTAHALVVFIGAHSNYRISFVDMDVCSDFHSSYEYLKTVEVITPLSSSEFRPFWISWDSEKVSIGRGLVVGQDKITAYDWPEEANSGVNDVFLAGFSSYEVQLADDFCNTAATDSITETTTEAIAETKSETTAESVIKTASENPTEAVAETTAVSNAEVITRNTHETTTEAVFQTTVAETPTDSAAETVTQAEDAETTPAAIHAATSTTRDSETSSSIASHPATTLQAEETTTGASTATLPSTPPPPLPKPSREQRGCSCIRDEKSGALMASELENSKRKAEAAIQKELTVPAGNTSSSRRGRISAEDKRSSVSVMGGVGAALCSLPLVAVVLADVAAAVKHLWYAVRHWTDV